MPRSLHEEMTVLHRAVVALARREQSREKIVPEAPEAEATEESAEESDKA